MPDTVKIYFKRAQWQTTVVLRSFKTAYLSHWSARKEEIVSRVIWMTTAKLYFLDTFCVGTTVLITSTCDILSWRFFKFFCFYAEHLWKLYCFFACYYACYSYERTNSSEHFKVWRNVDLFSKCSCNILHQVTVPMHLAVSHYGYRKLHQWPIRNKQLSIAYLQHTII